MLSKISNAMSNYFIKRNVIKEEDRESYNFYFEITLSTLINALAITLIAILFKLYVEALLFSITFMVFRGSCGGAHAKTHFKCLIGLLMIFTPFILGIKLMQENILSYISIGFYIVGSIIILILCPIDNINKHLTQLEKKKHRKKARVLLIVFAMPIVFLSTYNLGKYSFTLSYPFFCVALSLVVGLLNNYKEKITNIEIRDIVEDNNIPKST